MLKRAYDMLFRSGHRLAEAARLAKAEFGDQPDVMTILGFLEGTKRGICRSVVNELRGGWMSVSGGQVSENRGVDFEAPDRLERDFGCEIRVAAQLKEGIALAEGAILAHVAPGLAHEPDGGRVNWLEAARVQKP